MKFYQMLAEYAAESSLSVDFILVETWAIMFALGVLNGWFPVLVCQLFGYLRKRFCARLKTKRKG